MILVVGMSHRTVSLDALARLAISDMPATLKACTAEVDEAVILSTCNRVEIYASAAVASAAARSLRAVLAAQTEVPGEDLEDLLYVLTGADAAAHLFSVACGIDSVVIGEPQILDQVGRAARIAAAEGACGPALTALFGSALRTGKRARSETSIGHSSMSYVGAAIAVARSSFDDLRGRAALVLGAGTMAKLAAEALAGEAARVTVCSRRMDSAGDLARRIGADATPIQLLPEALECADLAVCSISSRRPLIGRDLLAEVMLHRSSRPLVAIDLSIPRGVEASAASVPGVTLHDLGELRRVIVAEGARIDQIERVREIVASEAGRAMPEIEAAGRTDPALRRPAGRIPAPRVVPAVAAREGR